MRMKKRIALYLSMILAVLAALECLPMTTKEVQAAYVDYDLYWTSGIVTDWDADEQYFQMEAKMSVSLADLLEVDKYTDNGYSTPSLAKLSGVTYESTNPSVASVSAKGLLTAKAPGETVLTIRFKDEEKSCKVIVVKAGGLGSGSAGVKKIDSLAKKVVKAYNNKITMKNAYKVQQTLCDFDIASSKSKTMSSYCYGFRYDKNEDTGRLVSTACLKIREIWEELYEFANKENPLGTCPAKIFMVSSVSAKKGKDTFTVNLKKKVTDRQIFALKMEGKDTYFEDDKKAKCEIAVVDKSTGREYWGVATVKEGSKKFTVEMDYLKLKAKRTYLLAGVSSGKGKTFKAK